MAYSYMNNKKGENMKNITEEMGVHKKWYEEARKMTPEKLPEFIRKLTEDYNHDYGTICHAASASAVAAAWAIDKSKQGGITGYQAGAIMWGFITNWMSEYKDKPIKLVDYSNMLYPQYDDKFNKTISKDTFEWLQKEAQKNIDEADEKQEKYLIESSKYSEDIMVFVKKYPDYYSNKEYYDPLGMGTGDQWDAESKKKESGFEFAPQPPYEGVTKESNIYKHWNSIVRGVVPFGFLVKQ